jgi:energy-coupling factor transporter ATP-binding protein EcfA2
MKFTGKNFQGWRDFSLDIGRLTMLTGPSSGGKSAIFRALKGILRNELDAAFIRNPKKEPLELTLEIDGHTITATRSKKGGVVYTVDGEKYSKLNEDIPGPVANLGFGDVTIGKTRVDPIFARQNSSQFLIDGVSPTETNAILGAFGGTERLEMGKKEANLRVTQKNGDAKAFAAEIQEAEARKDKLADLAKAGQVIVQQVSELESSIRKLEGRVCWLDETLLCRRRLAPLRRIQNALTVPDLTEADRLEQQIQQWMSARQSTLNLKWLHKYTTLVDEVTGRWPEVVRLWKRLGALEDAATLASRKRRSSVALVRVIETLETTLREIIVAQGSIRLISTALTLRRGLADKAARLREIEGRLPAAEEESRRGLCPRCGGPLEHICE